jgi:hypothetical protein
VEVDVRKIKVEVENSYMFGGLCITLTYRDERAGNILALRDVITEHTMQKSPLDNRTILDITAPMVENFWRALCNKC